MGPFEYTTYANNVGRLIGSWYVASSDFVYPISPWFIRGGHFSVGSEGGMFDFSFGSGGTDYMTFRVILTP